MFRILVNDGSRQGGAPGVRVASVPGWAVGFGAFGAALLGLTLFVIGAGLALVLAPIAIGAIALARWRLRSFLRKAQEQAAEMHAARAHASQSASRQQPSDPNIIDGEYRVIETGSR